MNWIERLYEIEKSGRKDLYSQNGEGLILEYVIDSLGFAIQDNSMFDIGGGDGFYLSNSRHLYHLGMGIQVFDKENGFIMTLDNCCDATINMPLVISMDTDGNDYWLLNKQLSFYKPAIVCAEFNPAFGDSRTIKYNPDHIWDGTDYYGFSFHAGVKLAEANGYEVIFQIADMNMIMVREDLIKVPIPPVIFKLNNFFKPSELPESDWVFV